MVFLAGGRSVSLRDFSRLRPARQGAAKAAKCAEAHGSPEAALIPTPLRSKKNDRENTARPSRDQAIEQKATKETKKASSSPPSLPSFPSVQTRVHRAGTSARSASRGLP